VDGDGGRAGGAVRWWAIVVAAVALAAVAVTLPTRAEHWARAAAGVPTAGHEASPQPLGEPPSVPFPGTSYAFLDLQNDGGTPVAWDPCRPVHYVVRRTGAPPWGQELLTEAVNRVSTATGLMFVADGPTDEVPTAVRPSFRPEFYGDRWAPVLVSWETELENADFATEVVGQARSVSMRQGRGPTVYVTGQIRLDSATLGQLLTRPEGRDLARAVIEHELGHLVGLAHVDDPMEVMYPRANPVITQLGPGDVTGLAALGRGPCVPEL